jgi:hypothetical protein
MQTNCVIHVTPSLSSLSVKPGSGAVTIGYDPKMDDAEQERLIWMDRSGSLEMARPPLAMNLSLSAPPFIWSKPINEIWNISYGVRINAVS